MADVGRPTVMTPEVVGKLEEAFLLGCSDLEACLVANISKQSLYDYQAKYPEFADRKEQLKKTPTYNARKTVATEVKSNAEIAMKYLERKEKDEFSSKSEINTNLTFTQMPSIEVKDAAGAALPAKLTFNIGE